MLAILLTVSNLNRMDDAMPINRSKQSWNIGDRVNVGFMRNLEVLEIQAIYDFKPDIYILRSDKGIRYSFTPHNGIERLDD